METLTERIKDDMKACMKSSNKERLGVIRLILAAIKQVEVDERITLDDARTVQILDKMVKQRRESIKQFTEGGRNDLAAQEEAELLVIQDFLPPALSDAEIDVIIQQAITETGATSVKDMGKVMGLVKTQVQGKADMAAVGAKIKAALSG